MRIEMLLANNMCEMLIQKRKEKMIKITNHNKQTNKTICNNNNHNIVIFWYLILIKI